MKSLFSNAAEPEPFSLLALTSQAALTQKVVEPLKTAGYQVLAASRAEEVITLLDNLKLPDLLIIDLMMPNLDIPPFLETLRLRFGRVELPPVLLLAPDNSSEQLAHDLQVEDYLPEPFDQEALLDHVQRLLAASQPKTD